MTSPRRRILRPVRVEAYAGQRAEERPLAFARGDERRAVTRILRRWRSEDAARRRRDYFRVLADDGENYLLCYDWGEELWYLVEETGR